MKVTETSSEPAHISLHSPLRGLQRCSSQSYGPFERARVVDLKKNDMDRSTVTGLSYLQLRFWGAWFRVCSTTFVGGVEGDVLGVVADFLF